MRPLLLLALAGCAVPMSSLHTGRTVPRGRVELDLAEGVNIDSTFVNGTVNAGKLAANEVAGASQGEETVIDDNELQNIGRATLAWSIAPPLPITEARLKVGVARHVEIGGMLSSGGFGGHAKLQLMDSHEGDPVDLAVAFQAQHTSFDLHIPGALSQILSIEEMSRTDLFLPVAVSRELGEQGEYGFFYGGGRLQLSLLQADTIEHITSVAGVPAELSGPMVGGGLFGGVGLGYRYVFLTAELSANLYSYRPELIGTTLRYQGVDFYPLIGLRVQGWDPLKQG